MTPTIADASLVIWNYLKTHVDATNLRALIVDGETNILEAGDVTPSILSSAVDTRRVDEEGSLALAISVQDAGETQDPRVNDHFLQTVIVCVYDRGKGYRNLRSVRIELMSLLEPKTFYQNIAAGQGAGILSARYESRSGHRWAQALISEYEAITYTYRIVKR